MTTITTRAGKGGPLSFVELDANFTNLNSDKLESSALAPYETTAHAAATYETITGAASTYETAAHATTTYETKSNATTVYATKINPETTGTFVHTGVFGSGTTPRATWSLTAGAVVFPTDVAVWSLGGSLALSANIVKTSGVQVNATTGYSSYVYLGPSSFNCYLRDTAAAGSLGTLLHSFGLSSQGNLTLSSPSGGIGYGAGSGGQIVQGTSRTTGVTINKPVGGIVLFTAAGSATPTSFLVTNSVVGINDIISVSVQGGSNNYIAFTNKVSAGSFTVTFWAAAGTASDTPTISFAVIRGSQT